MQSSDLPSSSRSDGDIKPQKPLTLVRPDNMQTKAPVPHPLRRSIRFASNGSNNPADGSGSVAPPPSSGILPTPQAEVNLNDHPETTAQTEVAIQKAVSPFVTHIMAEIQDKFNRAIEIVANASASAVPTPELQSDSLIEGLDALRRIYTAWSRYPQMGGAIGNAAISTTDYRFTALHAVSESEIYSLSRRIAKFMASTVDPDGIEFETLVHAQKRIDECFLAMKKQYLIWQTQLEPEKSLTDDELNLELTSAATGPITYHIQPPLTTFSAPSTSAQLMSSQAIAAMTEDESHDNVHIYVTGKVLKNKVEKIADAAERLAETKASEAKAAKAAKEAAKADRVPKGRAGKKAIVSASSDHEEADVPCTPKPARNPTMAASRKRPASAIDADEGNEAGDSKKTPAPSKRTKKEDGKTQDKSNEGSSEKGSDGNNDRSSGTPNSGTTAFDNAKRGGAAPKWLRDEDNLGKQLIVDHPEWPMPRIYRKFNEELANTPYKTDKMEAHDYRSDWIEFPRIDADGKTINDKEARKKDICWRTYESVRQHLEKHKASVHSNRGPDQITWDEITENPVAHLPKRDPPPRPTYFKDGTTLVDPVGSPAPASTASAIPADTPKTTFRGQDYYMSSGWTAINDPVSGNFSPVDSSPPAPLKRKRASKGKGKGKAAELPQIATSAVPGQFLFMEPETPTNPGHLREESVGLDDIWADTLPPVEQSAPGDAKYNFLEDFVNDMSSGEDDEEEASNDIVADSAATAASRAKKALIVRLRVGPSIKDAEEALRKLSESTAPPPKKPETPEEMKAFMSSLFARSTKGTPKRRSSL